jgi:hypothetical protein
MKFILVDRETLLGSVDSKKGMENMRKLHKETTGRTPTVYCNVDGNIHLYKEEYG